MALVNYLGTYDALDQVWETFPEGGKEGDYLYVAGTLKKWDKYTSAWIDPSDEDLAESTIVTSEEDVIVGSSTLINYLGRFEVLEDALNAYPEGGNEGDYLYVGDAIYAWDKYANEWVVSNDTPISVVMTDDEIIPNSTRFINYLGGFVDRATVWQKYPEGGNEGDYIYIAGELHIWDKYINNWVVAEPPAESSQIRPIEYLAQDGVVEYSENYINYLGVFDTIEQAWEVYPEGGKEGDYIIVGGEQLRWNKYTSNWGEYDPDANTPARPMATVFGDLHVFNDVIIGEELRARILETFTTKKWILGQKYISLEAITYDVVMSKVVVDGKTIVVQNGKLVALVEDNATWESIKGKPAWIKDTPPTLDEIAGGNGDGVVTLLSDQDIQGVKDFKKGIKVNGSPLFTYDPTTQSWVLEGNLITTGGIAARAALGALDVPTIMDALVVDESFIVDNGVLKLNPNLDLGGLDTEELENYLTANKYATITDISSALEPYIKSDFVEKNYSSIEYVDDTFIRLAGEPQSISARHDFTDGLKIGGLPIYKSQDDTLYLDCNLVVRGGATARGTNETVTASIFDALPIDGTTIKRTTNGELYVDAEALNIGGGGGVADSVSWENVTGKPSWIGSTKPTYTPQEVGALGALDNAVSASTLLMEDLADLNNATAGRFFTMTGGYGSTDGNKPDKEWATGVTLCLAGNSSYRRQLSFSSTDNIYFRREENGSWRDWKRFLTEVNYADFALPLTGGTVTGDLSVAGNINAQTQFHLNGKEVMGYWGNNYYLFAAGADMTVYVGGSKINFLGNLTVNASSGWGQMVNGGTSSTVAIGHSDGYGMFIGSALQNTSSSYIFRVWQGSTTGAAGTGVAVLDVLANRNVNINGNLLVIGGITVRYTSDERLKTNLRPINAGKMILSLGRVREFEYINSEVEKNNLYKGSHIGLIYQDVKGSALPKMCFEREDGYGSLNYWDPSLKALLVGVAQEHEVRLNAHDLRMNQQDEEMRKLHLENKRLKKRIKQLEKRVA